MEFFISQKDWKKVIDYAQASYDEFSAEVGGFMIAKKDKDGNIIISDPEILKQEVTGGTTVMAKEAVADYYVKCAQKYGSDVRFVWWHSHANMQAFWSGTDTSTMKEYSSGDWSAFLVVNIRSEYKFRICVWNPIEAHKDIELNILGQKARKVPKTIKDTVSKLCSSPKVVTGGWKNTNQVSIYDRYDGSFGYNYGYNYYGYSYNDSKIPIHLRNTTKFKETIDFIEELNDRYIEGQVTFKDWLKSVKSWNDELKEDKLRYSISEVTENELHSKCGIYAGYDPTELINYEGKNEQNIKV